MVEKIINATEIKKGTNILVDGTPCNVKKFDISKTGKHGHSKVRVEAIGIVKGQKKVFVIPGHDKVEVPTVDKRKGQVLSKDSSGASIMDLENFETINVPCPDKELLETVEENSSVEYWDVEGEKIIMRKL